MEPSDVLLLGASTRAAAFSALRAGLRPWCIDLFGDRDLRLQCPVRRVNASEYPRGLVRAAEAAPPAPWMYTGGIENHVGIISRVSAKRTLWGNGPHAVRAARSPNAIRELLTAAGLAYPQLQLTPPPSGIETEWLVKPMRGSGGRGIKCWRGQPFRFARTQYFQEYIEGTSCSAVYVGTTDGAELLGVTRQLSGERWLHAAPFCYCGSVGPFMVSAALEDGLQRLGHVLARGARLRGLFGVDFILRDDTAYPVDINPRYTASVEVLELAGGISAIARHRRVFDDRLEPVTCPSAGRPAFIGKAILFAKRDGSLPDDGPWMKQVREPGSIWSVPSFADIPEPGTPFRSGEPIMTLFCTGDSEAECLSGLRDIARNLDRSLGGE